MCTLTDVSTFDATVYRYETTDPVAGGAGGVANQPLQNLANRTRFLLDQTNAILAALGGFAPINSPTFTGTPRAPTPAASASGTEMITAAFARTMQSGCAYITINGDTTLTAVQAGYGSLAVSGTTNADSFLLFPPGPGCWKITNTTTHRLKCRLASGGNVITVAAGNKTVWTDGYTMVDERTDFENVVLAGSSTVNTPPTRTDRSNLIPNTIWVGDAIYDEAQLRISGDASIRGDVAAGYVQGGFAQARNTRGNFLPGDGFDVPIALSFTVGRGGYMYVTAALIHTYQTPNPTYLRLYINSVLVIEEYTYQTKPIQYSFPCGAGQTYTIEAHCVTGGGGGWCQMSLGLGAVFVPH